MLKDLEETQGSDLDQAAEAEALEAESPAATDGEGSSPSDEETQGNDIADAIRDEFLEKYGEKTDDEEGEETPASEEEAASEGTDGEETKVEDSTDQATSERNDQEEDIRIPDDQWKGLPDNVRQRVGQLNTRARRAEKQIETLTQERATFEDKANRFDVLDNYARENEIQPENISKAYGMMAMLSKQDFAGFLKEVTPYVALAQQALGQSIDPELQQRVDDGYLSEEDAMEITKARVGKTLADGRAEAARTREQARSTEDANQRTMTEIVSAVNARELELKSTDPEYAQKAAQVKNAIKLALESGARPQTKEEGVALVNKAYELVNETFVAPRPAPKPTNRKPSSVNTPPRTKAPAGNLLDALTQASEAYVPK